jgi:hypothetical protein
LVQTPIKVIAKELVETPVKIGCPVFDLGGDDDDEEDDECEGSKQIKASFGVSVVSAAV